MDLSDKAIQVADSYIKEHHVVSELIQGSATDIPFEKVGKLADGIVLSSILHEVYSYVPNGKDAWRKSIESAAKNLNNNGILLLRDFAGTTIEGDVSISFLSNFAREFYEYFRERYRTFQTWEEGDRKCMQDRRISKDDFPAISLADESLSLPFVKAAEMMLHFRNYADHVNKQLIEIAEPTWKEADETYLIPDPTSQAFQVMPPNIYVVRVIQSANHALKDTDTEFVCRSRQISPRPNTSTFLKLHFGLEKENTDSDELFDQIPQKMELVFQKIRKNFGDRNGYIITTLNEQNSPAVNELLSRYPQTPIIDIEEKMTEEDFDKQKKKQEEYPIEGASNGIVTTKNNEIVLTKRSGPHPGWALPAGRVEKDESFDHAFDREVLEECGITIRDTQPLVIERKTFISPGNERLPFLLVTFVGKNMTEQIPYQTEDAMKEGLEVKSFALDALPDDMLQRDRQKIIEYFHL